MARIEKRLQIRLYGEDDGVSDEGALLDTLVIRYINRLQDLSNYSMKSWVQQALRNQYILDHPGKAIPSQIESIGDTASMEEIPVVSEEDVEEFSIM